MITKEKEFVDVSTGEILSRESTVIKKVRADEFIQVYLEDFASLLQITSKAEMNILVYFWKYSVYVDDSQVGNMVKVDRQLKDKIINQTGLTDGTIRNTVSSLKKKNLIISDSDYAGIYYLNPTYFFKGSLADRAKCYKKTIEYVVTD